MLIFHRCLVVALEFSMAALQNGELQPEVGALSMEAYLIGLSATVSQQPSNLAAIGDSTGSRTQIIPQ